MNFGLNSRRQEMSKVLLCIAAVSIAIPCGLVSDNVFAVESEVAFTVPDGVGTILRENCVDCHNSDQSEGNVDFTRLADAELSERLEVLNKAQEQLHFNLMPPKDAGELAG